MEWQMKSIKMEEPLEQAYRLNQETKIQLFLPCDFYGIDEGYYEMSNATYKKIKTIVAKLNRSNFDKLYDKTLEQLSKIVKQDAVFIEEMIKFQLVVIDEQIEVFENNKKVAGYSKM